MFCEDYSYKYITASLTLVKINTFCFYFGYNMAKLGEISLPRYPG